jgi:hypothetical protein
VGLEAECVARAGHQESEGHARLEEKDLHFRGSFKLKIPFSEIHSAEAKKGWLHVAHDGGTAALQLGAAAELWALKIRYPRGLIDKLGIKPDSRVAVLGVTDESFRAKLAERTQNVRTRLQPDTQVIIWGAKKMDDLAKLSALRASMAADGAIWVIWPKGKPELKEDHVRAAALKQGLVDVKVVSFSETHSGLKLMIPRRLR